LAAAHFHLTLASFFFFIDILIVSDNNKTMNTLLPLSIRAGKEQKPFSCPILRLRWGQNSFWRHADGLPHPDHPVRSRGDRLRQREADKATIRARLQELESQQRARHIQLSPEAPEEIFTAWREQVAESLGRQDIQAARVLIERFIIKIELGYDQVIIRYRYPLEAGLGRQGEKTTLEAVPIERSLHDMDRKSIQTIYKLAPHLAEKPLPPRKPRPVDPRNLEIYRLHTEEKRPSGSLQNNTDYLKSGFGISALPSESRGNNISCGERRFLGEVTASNFKKKTGTNHSRPETDGNT